MDDRRLRLELLALRSHIDRLMAMLPVGEDVGPVGSGAIGDTLARVRDFCRENSIRPDAGGMVNERDAAVILRVSRSTMKRKRIEGTGPEAHDVEGRWRYRLADLASRFDSEKFD